LVARGLLQINWIRLFRNIFLSGSGKKLLKRD
jgi:hypothetical protein